MNTYDLIQLPYLKNSGDDVPKLNEAGAELTPLQYLLAGGSSTSNLVPRSLLFLLNRMYGGDVESLRQ